MTDVVLALVRRGGRWFLQRRSAGNPVMPGLWEFPGGKAGPSEPLLDALRRELAEEVGIVPRAAVPLPVLEGPTRLHPFLVEGVETPRTDLAWGWFTLAEMAKLPIPPANARLVRRLADLPRPGAPA